MRAYLFLLLLCPVVLLAQEQPVNGSTDCPTFGKKNVNSKAGIFQYMRTHKPQKKDVNERPVVYQTSALPDLKKAQEDREAAAASRQNNQPAVAKKQRPVKAPKAKKEPVVTENTEAPEEEVAIAAPVKREAKPAETKEIKEETIASENDPAVSDAKEKRDKKMRKAARKGKVQRIFKRTNKPTSRKNVQKCPSF